MHSLSDPKLGERQLYKCTKTYTTNVRKDPTGHYLERTMEGNKGKALFAKTMFIYNA